MRKNIKKGFTLAETLIAIAIVGVVAAITIPTAIDNTRNKKLATSLGRSVEAIETGCELIVQHASEKSEAGGNGVINGIYVIHKNLDSAVHANQDTQRLVSDNLFSDSASEYFNAVPITPTNSYKNSVKNITGGNPNPTVNSIATKFAVSSKLGAYYGYLYKKETNSNFETLEDPIFGYVYIDVNGKNTPNKYGRDIYLFGLTDSCHMVPAGTNRIHSMESSIAIESDGCNGDTPSNGLSCTSRVVKNGYKMDY